MKYNIVPRLPDPDSSRYPTICGRFGKTSEMGRRCERNGSAISKRDREMVLVGLNIWN
jgi:hypothetical protein